MIRAIVFDFDGLIVNTETPVLESWQEIYREHGHEITIEQWAANVGSGQGFDALTHLQELTGLQFDREALTVRRRQRQLEMVALLPILSGVEERIAEAQAMGLALGVASSSSRAWVEGHLTRLGLMARFGAVRAWDDPDVLARKPDPAVYLATLRALGAAPAEAIAIEDSPNGVLAARRAGMGTVAVPNEVTRRMPPANADVTIESLADMTLRDLIDAVERAGRSGQGAGRSP